MRENEITASNSDHNEVVLRDESNGRTYHLSVAVTGGDLVFSGQIIDQDYEKMFGDTDYEYWLTVHSQDVPKVLLELIKDRFQNETDFRKWLESKNIPSEFNNYF